MIKKQGLSLLLAALMVFSLSGCGQEVQETTSGKNIELVEIPYWDFEKLDWNYIKEKCKL